jgi:tripartite-type tricarboxylate transporter receptor subunit TctC
MADVEAACNEEESMAFTKLCGFVLALLFALPVHAQSYPAKPVRIVVPFPAGGGLDFTTRVIARKLGDAWGQTVIVENRPGASGMIGAESVVRSPKDGYTLLSCSPAEVALNAALYPKMSYDPMRDLAPISLTAIYANVIAVHASVPARNWKELVALSKRTPGGVGFASSGTGSTQHLTGEWLKRNAGITLLHVPYKGAAPATADLIGGQIPSGILGAAPLIPHLQTGRIRAIAVTTEKRAAVLPEVPTLAEVGVKGFTSSQWFGLLAPAGTPREVIAKINADVQKVLASPDIKEKLATQGGETYGSTPEAFAAFMKAEHDTYAKIIAQAGIKVD